MALLIVLSSVSCVASSKGVKDTAPGQSTPHSAESTQSDEEKPEEQTPSTSALAPPEGEQSEKNEQSGPAGKEGSLEDGSLEEGSLEDGSLEDGSLEDGSLEEGSLEEGKDLDTPWAADRTAPMDHNKLMLAVIQEAESRFTPIRKEDGSPLMITVDLDQNGQADPMVLTIEKGKASPFLEDLSDVGRLYDPEQKPVNYYLSVYFQIQGKLVSMYRIPFGGRRVLGTFESFNLKEGELLPLAIEVSFQNKEGTSTERVIFSQHNRFSIFSSSKTVSTGSYMEDIDQDGILDLIEWKTGIEEGTGYETFLTWYRWNGSAYREFSHTNIVRNLNRFLEEIESALLGSSLTAIEAFLPQEEMDILGKNTLSGEGAEPSCENIRSIIYPPILESPFRLYKPGRRSFLLDLRLLCETGETRLFQVRISLQKNPFLKPQFSISLQ